jgi:ATPase family associated with various cellular activities (AAA)
MEKLNFEQLRKETLVEVKNEFPARVSHGQRINSPLMKILFDYFNVLNDKKKMQKEQGMTVHGFINGANGYCENLPERVSGGLNYKVNLTYKSSSDEFQILVVLSRYQIDKNWVSEVSFTSNKSSYVSSEFIYKKIIYSAIAHSNLKGSYFEMPAGALAWDKKTLEKRGYEDIYLPEKTMQDLKLFTSLYEKKGEIMRYLFAGTPGTGKTESTLAISNILKEQGVTIIKTVVCDALKEKVELAELLSPSLIIFDDIDLSLGSRTKGGVSKSLGLFLDALDGTDKISGGVGIIATTNSIDLLDLAAQRPGRFDKIMSFDEITDENIRDIILKSLKFSFGFGKNHSATKKFSDPKVVSLFKRAQLTGAHVYTYTKQIMRKIDTLDIKDYDANWIVEEIESELTTVRTITNSKYLSDGKLKGKDESKAMGLVPNDYIEDEDVEAEGIEYTEDVAEESVEEGPSGGNEEIGQGGGDDMHEKGLDD